MSKDGAGRWAILERALIQLGKLNDILALVCQLYFREIQNLDEPESLVRPIES